MAARINRIRLDDNWRLKIRTSMLIDRLEKHALGEIEMSATQIKAAETLLKKVAPDLQAIQHTGDAEGGLLGILAGLNDRSGAGDTSGVDSPLETPGTDPVCH
jgi:hypothetical protein